MALINRSPQFKQLERRLQEVGERRIVGFTSKKRDAMKSRVLGRIETAMEAEVMGFEQLTAELEKLTLSVEPTQRLKVETKENVLDLLSLRTQRLWVMDFAREFVGQRRTWAGAMATLVLFVSGLGYVSHLPQVAAAKMSSVEGVRGTVMLEREGNVQDLAVGMMIQEGDRLVTGEDGWLDVVFEDDSLFTMGPGTIAEVEQLWVNAENEAHTAIDIDLSHGRVWAEVVNLLANDSYFQVNSGDVSVSVDRRGRFDFVASDEGKSLRVFDHLVDFSVHEEGVVHDGTLGPNLGFTLAEDVLTIEKIESVDVLKSQDVWVQANWENSQQHRAHVDSFYADRLKNQAGVLPGDFRYSLKRTVEEAQLLLSFGVDARSEAALMVAETRFAEAVALAKQGEVELSYEKLNDYQDRLVDLAEVNPNYAQSIQALVEEGKKVLEGVHPEDPLYGLRKVMDATSVLVTSDLASKQILSLETTADRLGLALEFIQIGAYDLAQTSLEDYQVGYMNVLDQLGDLEMDNRREVILEILDQKLRDLQHLKLIQAELEALEAEGVELDEQLMSLKQDTLYQINTLVLNLKERAVLHLGTFLEDVKRDESLQLEVLSRMKKNVPLEFEFMEKINDVESLYLDDRSDVVVLEEALVVGRDVELDEYREEETVD